MNEEGVRVFLSYSQKDQALVDQLMAYLAALELRGEIQFWHEHQIEAGMDWGNAILSALDSADIILLVLSPYFLASIYSRIEVEEALQRHKAGQAFLIPVLLSPVMFSPFDDIQGSPRNGRPITTWESKDEAFLSVARDIQGVAERLRAKTIISDVK